MKLAQIGQGVGEDRGRNSRGHGWVNRVG
jgi:hypothetical protein